jgi:hypothetical protein
LSKRWSTWTWALLSLSLSLLRKTPKLRNSTRERRREGEWQKMSGIFLRKTWEGKKVFASFACEHAVSYLWKLIASICFRKIKKTDNDYTVARFKGNTGISNLRKHLYLQHLDEWVKSCADLNISITAKAAVEAIEKSGGIVLGEAEKLQFSKDAFTDALMEFVVGDDQVSITILHHFLC